MKQKNLLLITGSVLCVGVLTAAILGNKNIVNTFQVEADLDGYAITCTSSANKLHNNTDGVAYDGDATLKTKLGSDIGFTYSQVKGSDSSWHVLKDGGYFYNTSPIHGLQQLTLSFNTDNASFDVYYSNDTSFTTKKSLTSSNSTVTAYNFDNFLPRYFKIVNTSGGDLDISSLSTDFECIDYNYYNLSIKSENEAMGTVSGDSGYLHTGTRVKVLATPNEGYHFRGWFNDQGTLLSTSSSYSFLISFYNCSLTAKFMTDEEYQKVRYGINPTIFDDGKTIIYGLYPQSHVNDSELIVALNNLSTPETNGWYLYEGNYYAKLSAHPEHDEKYFNNGEQIINGTTYWFECQPIEWNVLSNNGEKYFILSSVLLDTGHPISYTSEDRTIDGQTIYSNNYQYSDMRTWLNGEFYNSAFALNNSYILTTTVDNSATTTCSSTNIYASNNTEDKVFLPSYQDYINPDYGFESAESAWSTRMRYVTDYAIANGAWAGDIDINYNAGAYYTRSPSTTSGSYTSIVVTYGSLITDSSCTALWYLVRPALNIKIA